MPPLTHHQRMIYLEDAHLAFNLLFEDPSLPAGVMEALAEARAMVVRSENLLRQHRKMEASYGMAKLDNASTTVG